MDTSLSQERAPGKDRHADAERGQPPVQLPGLREDGRARNTRTFQAELRDYVGGLRELLDDPPTDLDVPIVLISGGKTLGMGGTKCLDPNTKPGIDALYSMQWLVKGVVGSVSHVQPPG